MTSKSEYVWVFILLSCFAFIQDVLADSHNKCCEKLVIRASQNAIDTGRYKGRTFHIFASDMQSNDKDFQSYASSLARLISEQFGAYYSPSADGVSLKVFVHYDSTGLAYAIDKSSVGAYADKSCLYSNDARLARHKFFVDIVDSKTNKTVFESRATSESVMKFGHIAHCIIEATVYDVKRSYKSRVSICDSCN